MSIINVSAEQFMMGANQIKWLNDLMETGKIPSKEDVLNTVSYKATWNIDAITNVDGFTAVYRARDIYTGKFGFSLITKEVAEDFGKFFDGKTVLEVCAGSGYLSKCIKESNPNVNMITTDNYDWEIGRSYSEWKQHFCEVENIDAIDAIKKYAGQIDYVLVSWPPYENPIATLILDECLKTGVPLVYIGEDYGGCTGSDSFFELMYDRGYDLSRCITKDYIPFNAIHDNIYLVTKNKEK